jgi:DNA-binding CsgD family transcriptional regulator
LAEEAAEVVLSSPSATLFHELHVREGLALMATQRSDAAKASEQYAAMERFPHTMSESCYYTLDHLLGLLAHTMRRQDIASAHFEDALTFCRKAGYRPALAWTCYDYANLLHQQREQKKALALLDEALSISTELNMRPLAGKATALRGNIEAMPASAPTYPADLTERQAEVLRLIAQGKTDREIAQELVLSIRTVQRHIADIYDKIGARNRAEATAFALDKLPSSR